MFVDSQNFERVDDLYTAPEGLELPEEPRKRAPPGEPNPYADEAQRLEDSDDSAARDTAVSPLLAVQNYDWQHLSVTDLAELFLGLAREAGGAALEVTVHRSLFGQERLREEGRVGPQAALRAAFGDAEGKNPTALRKYELERLRYYFAIVRFDSAETAAGVYDQFDGAEVGFSGCKLDLRFVAADLALPAPEARAVPTGEGKALPRFETKAKAHSNVELTWEAPRPAPAADLFNVPLESLDPALLREVVDTDEEDDLDIASDALRQRMMEGPSMFTDFEKGNRGGLRVEFETGFAAETEPRRAEGRRKSRKELLRGAKEKALQRKAAKKQEEELALLVESHPSVAVPAAGEDVRFQQLRTDAMFAVDPTHPRFGTRERVAAVKQKKLKKKLKN